MEYGAEFKLPRFPKTVILAILAEWARVAECLDNLRAHSASPDYGRTVKATFFGNRGNLNSAPDSTKRVKFSIQYSPRRVPRGKQRKCSRLGGNKPGGNKVGEKQGGRKIKFLAWPENSCTLMELT